MKTLQALVMAVALPLVMNAMDANDGIRSVLSAQVEAWNKGDIPAFVASYAENCTFVGKKVMQGRDKVQARYRENYPTPEKMGKLTFSKLVVRQLDEKVAVVTGEFQLERSAAGGGNASGIFSLVFEWRGGQWMIAMDHTS